MNLVSRSGEDKFFAPHTPGIAPVEFENGSAELVGVPRRRLVPSGAGQDSGNDSCVIDDGFVVDAGIEVRIAGGCGMCVSDAFVGMGTGGVAGGGQKVADKSGAVHDGGANWFVWCVEVDGE